MKGKVVLQVLLFLLTLVTTTLAGAEWQTGKLFFFDAQGGFSWGGDFTRAQLLQGLAFSLPFLGVLTVHEFGHYFTARYYKVNVTLPYYIPLWLGITASIGTMGAFIKIKDRIFSRKEFFDIGIAGPLAGFAVALPLLWYGFTHLPPAEHIYSIHPKYLLYGNHYADYVYQQGGNLFLGRNLLFLFFERFVADPALLPNRYELMHYPFLFAGFLSLFFTALNLLPIGQLDGGHIMYGLLGYERFNRLSPILFALFIFYAGLGLIPAEIPLQESYWMWGGYLVYLVIVFKPLFPQLKQSLFLVAGVFLGHVTMAFFFPGVQGYNGWLVFGLILARFMGVFHPPCPDERPLSNSRKWLGWLALVVLILCFSPAPFIID
ncbi:site-2 protease family protein [Nibribacter ruber]|uniref:Site-2 protease family protein n=1 Tax=Nibribacter ruber TaxID=2698458 RepID=A0A6P1NY15_9BACT|nr:site-2 protease family protein [Nibribacter ruber]QHL86828.1 site-2 protease family protein [Nibribacter ruber]